MPQFTPSSVHSATVNFANPKSAGFDYTASLCMGTGMTEMASASFHLDAGKSKAVPFSVTMPTTPGTYPVYFKVTCGGVLIGTFVATEDVVLAAPPAVEIVKAYVRGEYPSVSGAYSGWINFALGSDIPLGQIGGRPRVGVTLRNPTNAPLKYTITMYSYSPWQDRTTYLTLPSAAPQKVSYYICGRCGYPFYLYDHYEQYGVCPNCGLYDGRADAGNPPTGLPYGSYQYECDIFLAPGAELPLGKVGFVYTDLFTPILYWNYIYIKITCGSYDLGTTYLCDGWW